MNIKELPKTGNYEFFDVEIILQLNDVKIFV